MILRARYVASSQFPPVENGAVRVEHGRIQEVGPRSAFQDEPAADLGDVVLLPGLVNAHTHLELSHLGGRFPPSMGFVPWIEKIGAQVMADDAEPERFAQSARRGAAQSVQHGVTLACDISRRPLLTRPVLSNGPLRVVSCGEVIAIGKIRHSADDRIATALDRTWSSDFLRPGISPHAPYTVEPSVLKACVGAAIESGLPVCIHAAESREECEFTERHQGSIRDFLDRVGLWQDGIECPNATPIRFLADCDVLTPRTLLAHVNYVSHDEIRMIAESGATVVYCPRTHAAFGHDPHPWLSMLNAGINVCLGTDSLASNPDLSVLNEARFLWRRDQSLDPAMLFGMMTERPARALGMPDGYATLQKGSPADLTAIPLYPGGSSDPLANVLESDLAPTLTMIGGDVVQAEPLLQ